MIPPRADAVRILLCDDIRVEVDGRHSIIGVHGPTLRVEKLPVTHRGLSVFVQIVDPAEAYPGVEFELVAPDGSILARGGGPTPTAEQFPSDQPTFSTYGIHFSPLQLTAPGPYAVRVWFDRARDVGVEAKLAVKLGEAEPIIRSGGVSPVQR